MRKHKRGLAMFMIFLLLFPSFQLPVFAEEEVDPFEGMINISSDWQGSVFGDNGGQSNISSENFEITENENNTVTVRSSNNRGKIAGSTEGIAYYFKDVPTDGNYKISATAHVNAWTANNQVSFGIMLRGNVLENENQGTFTGDYVAVGALDQVMKGFYKYSDSGLQKNNHTFPNTSVPAAEETYELSIQKSGNLYILEVDGEVQTIEEYNGEINYAGLFTSRNTTVTFSDVKLAIDGQIELGDWEFSAFGDNTNITNNPPRNPDPTFHEDGSVQIVATGGKISSSVDGISFYHKEVPASANFEITSKAYINSINAGDNQVSFGLMLRDEIGEHGTTSGHTANYVAVGALDLNNASTGGMKGFYKEGSQQSKLSPFSDLSIPTAGEEYELSIKKAGNTYVVNVSGNEEVITVDDLFSENVFAGLYVARGADITFSNFDIVVDNRVVNELIVDSSEMTTEILMGQELDLTGLRVTARFSDGSEEELTPSDYIVTGFDSSKVGTNKITINYNGKTATVDLEILALTVTDLEIRYYPAKTDYYKGDLFDPQGFSVIAYYNNGTSSQLSKDLYSFAIGGQEIGEEGYTFTEAGTKVVTVISTETPEVTTSFEVVVKDADLIGLEIRQQPVKSLYYLGDELDLSGLSLYANYDDGKSVRLMADEYTVSALDTTTPGEREIILSHKGQTATLTFEVKEKELVAIEVTNYPKTTYVVGEGLDLDGLEISNVFDNGDRELLIESAYSIDSSAFNSSTAGKYDVVIVPVDDSIESINLAVTVRAETEVEWKTMRFGQSTSDARNYINVKDNGVIEIVALEGGGKITGDHDGISFYYTEIDATEDNFVLSADIKVIEYAKTPHDGQESFGIMARDAVNPVQDASVFASNIAAVGGFSGGTRDANGTQAFIRTGVVAADGEGSEGIQKKMIKNERPNASNTAENYRLTLTKTNSGYSGQLNNGEEAMFFEPDILDVQDGKIYVGFYTARLATIEVSNIDFTVTAAATDTPRVEPPAEPISPNFEYLSLARTPLTDYTLLLRANVDGVITVKQGHEVIAQDREVRAGEIVEIPATIAANSNTNFSTTFLPDDTQFLTSYNKIVHNVTVTNKTFVEDGNIYVSPTGASAGNGTKENPLDIDTAIDYVRPGQYIYVMEGHYVRNSNIEIKKFNDGTEGAMKYLVADPEATERPLIDFDRRSEGVVHSGNYWYVQGLDFARSAGNTKGYTIGGSYNIIDNLRLFEHGDTGLQISRTDTTENDREKWPSYNQILNSISFDNRDPSENNADGFAAKLTVGEGNVFDGNVSHNNIDDGWDLYTKVGTGAIGAVTIRNSIAFNNGRLTSGYEGNAGKNGFKLGGEGVHVPHVIENSIAFGNGYFGFTSNSNPGLIARNNIGFNNVGANLSFTTYAHIPTDFTIDGFVSYRTNDVPNANDNYPSHLNSDVNYMFRSGQSANASGEVLTDEILVSMEQIFNYDDQGKIVSIKRNENGEILWGDLWEVYNEFMGIEDETTPPGDDQQTHYVSEDDINEIAPGENFEINDVNNEYIKFVFTAEQVDNLLSKEGTKVTIKKADVSVTIPTVYFSAGKGLTIEVEEQLENTDDLFVSINGKEIRSKIYKFTIFDGENYITEFSTEPVLLEFTLDSENVENATNLKVFRFNGATSEWESRAGGYYEDGIFYYETNSFSIYAVMEVEQEDTTPPGSGEEEETPTPPGSGEEEETPTPPGSGEEGETPTPPGSGEEEETPTPPGSGEEEETPTPPGDGTGDGNKESNDDTKKESSKEKLPDTNSGLYNWLIVGMLLVVAGVTVLITRRRKEDQTA
ncbi:bacterial Ig-like domain-containing protein [Evansella sp. AB-rgal1]|uniref:bacterial Ig-like domain-containing protein n=1 Tax=Evansella sp. AB-rgal1 TaxID=3242696 RepID=UPI00359E15F1